MKLVDSFRALVGGGALLVATGATTVLSGMPAIGQEAELPVVSFTTAQADRGRSAYQTNCVDCHGANLDDGEFGGPPLKGMSFKEKWFNNTADGLFDFVKATMPPDRPGALNDQTYADLVAYILSRNGLQAGAAELPADSEALSKVEIR
ncbi:c-type cytochrome [Chelativorans sp. J32]|uniref:c-type cytochrome n=1 Tax=Chelativorans sp. J32 TaxID=935840 RepID=UPI0004B26FE0|nr:cytochrome c [Chelativorans sp. J32]